MSGNDESSNDVEAVEVTEPSDENQQSKPLLRMLKHLIVNNSNMVQVQLTNAKIMYILKTEFSISDADTHPLEIDICIGVIKRFLKLWPDWDKYDSLISSVKDSNDKEAINNALQEIYLSLKSYLKKRLEIAVKKAKEKIKTLPEKEVKPSTSKEEFLDAYLEVSCPRRDLYELFYRYPNPDHDNSIFRCSKNEPTKISLDTFEFTDLFFLCRTAIIVKTKQLNLTWEFSPVYKYNLVNKKLNFQREVPEQDLKIINIKGCSQQSRTGYLKKTVEKVLANTLKASYAFSYVPMYTINLLFNLINKEIGLMPETIGAPGNFQRVLNEYPYIRYFCNEIDKKPSNDAKKKYDLQLEEIMIPKIDISLTKFNDVVQPGFDTQSVSVQCKECNNFSSSKHSMLESLKEHILGEHFVQKEWQCTSCNQTFTPNSLVNMKWYHKC